MKKLTELFDACFRIQREACEAAGRHVPLVVENVRGAIPWVGRSRWHYGSFHLWGDVPALMPPTNREQKFNPDGTGHPPGSWFAIADSKNRGSGSWFNVAHNTVSGKGNNPDGRKVAGFRFDGSGRSFQSASVEGVRGLPHRTAGHWTNPAEHEGVKHGGDCFNDPAWPGKQGGVKQPGIGGLRDNGKGDGWFQDGAAQHGSRSPARKMASAMIAKIPLALARWIGRAWWPDEPMEVAL